MKLSGMTASEVTIAAKMNGMHYGQYSFLAERGMVRIPRSERNQGADGTKKG